MDYDDSKHVVAIGALPVLARTLFRLHNFYGVAVATIADMLATDETSIFACLADARAMIDRQFPIWQPKPRLPFDPESRAAELEQRLQLDYRAALQAIFARGGFRGSVAWPDPPMTIEADEEAAARFVIAFLRKPLQKAHAQSAKHAFASIDLWRNAPAWRRVRRRRLLEIASEIRCSGWQPFDIWLADRIAPDLLYPSRLVLPHYQRHPLPEELTPPRAGYHMPCWPKNAARQQRFDRLPLLTRHVAALTILYGRSYYETARRLGISRRGARRHFRNALLVIAFPPRPPLPKQIYTDLKLAWRHLRDKLGKPADHG